MAPTRDFSYPVFMDGRSNWDTPSESTIERVLRGRELTDNREIEERFEQHIEEMLVDQMANTIRTEIDELVLERTRMIAEQEQTLIRQYTDSLGTHSTAGQEEVERRFRNTREEFLRMIAETQPIPADAFPLPTPEDLPLFHLEANKTVKELVDRFKKDVDK